MTSEELRIDLRRRDQDLCDIDWTVLPEGTRRWTFTAPSGPLSVIGIGDPSAPRVLLVPGVTGSKEDFHYLMREMVDAGFHVESFDLAGQYESASAGPWNLRPPETRYTMDLFEADLIAFIESGSAPVHLVGYSFAGLVAELVAVHRPELVRSLGLLGPPPDSGQSFRTIPFLGPLSRIARPGVAATLMRWGVVLNVLRVRPGRLRFVRHRFTTTRRDAHRDIMGLMMHTPDLEQPLAALGIPTLVAVGSRDLWPVRNHQRFAAAIGADFRVYSTGHSPCEDAPYELSADLISLFRRGEQVLDR